MMPQLFLLGVMAINLFLALHSTEGRDTALVSQIRLARFGWKSLLLAIICGALTQVLYKFEWLAIFNGITLLASFLLAAGNFLIAAICFVPQLFRHEPKTASPSEELGFRRVD
jgi:hypothetical protein